MKQLRKSSMALDCKPTQVAVFPMPFKMMAGWWLTSTIHKQQLTNNNQCKNFKINTLIRIIAHVEIDAKPNRFETPWV
jgi:hypothetical protein